MEEKEMMMNKELKEECSNEASKVFTGFLRGTFIIISDCNEGLSIFLFKILAKFFFFLNEANELFLQDFGRGSLPKSQTIFFKKNITKRKKKSTEHENIEQEDLILSFEEAFYLLFVENKLQIKENAASQTNLTLITCFVVFHLKDPKFLFSYATYHYYRKRGWIPKSGIDQYGLDFVLYKKASNQEEHFHSMFLKILLFFSF